LAIDITGQKTAITRIDYTPKSIYEVYADFDYYKDTNYMNLVRPAIFWPNGKSLGYGFAAHMSGAAKQFYAKFSYWGFEDLEDFYCLPIEKRNEFLEKAKVIWQEIFGVSPEQTWNNDKVQKEFHSRLIAEAKRTKDECYQSRRLRLRIRNEKARFKAEDTMRDRCRYHPFWEPVIFTWFTLQEKLKRQVRLRERLRL
jgi:hypothetical protein